MTPADVFPAWLAARVHVQPNGCWHFVGATQSKGYGALNLRLPGGRRLSLAHQVAQAVSTGRVLLPGWVWQHTCDDRICIHPTHTIAGTPADNNLDARRKGRHHGRVPMHGGR